MPVFPGAGFLHLTMIRSDHLDLASVPIFAAAPEQRPAHATVYNGDEPIATDATSAGLRLPL